MLQRITGEKKSQSKHTSVLSYFKKMSQPPQPSATTTLISSYQQKKTLHVQKEYDLVKAQMTVCFSNKSIFKIKVSTGVPGWLSRWSMQLLILEVVNSSPM